MRGGDRGGLRGQFDQARDIDLGWRRTTRQVALNAGQPQLCVTLTPPRNLHTPRAQLLSNVLVLNPVSGQQHNARTERQPDAA